MPDPSETESVHRYRPPPPADITLLQRGIIAVGLVGLGALLMGAASEVFNDTKRVR